MLINPAHIKVSEILNQGTVLVVDPTDNYRNTLKRFLTNFNVRTLKLCDSLANAKTEMTISHLSLLIVEWKLNGTQNGLQFCRELRGDKRYWEVPILLMSVEPLRSDVVLASEVGIDGYMLKPFSFEEFSDQLVQLFKKSSERVHFDKLLDQAEASIDAKAFVAAEALLLKCKRLDIQSARVQTGLARIRLANLLEDEALDLLKSATEANATYLEAYRYLLEIHERREDYHHVLHYGIRAHALSPDNPRYILMLAKAYLSIEDLTKSEDFFRKAIRISPSLAEAHKGLGDVQLIREDYEQAMACYQKAIDLDGNDVSIINSMGLVYIKLKRYQEGIKQYKLALQVDGENARVLFNLGHAYENLEDYTKAKDFYSKALIAEPDFEKPRRGLKRLEQLLQKKQTESK